MVLVCLLDLILNVKTVNENQQLSKKPYYLSRKYITKGLNVYMTK